VRPDGTPMVSFAAPGEAAIPAFTAEERRAA
jgi:hypothetical protein